MRAHEVNSHLEVYDDKAQELTQLVHAITSSEACQNELENILCEADEFGEDGGSMLRSIWEDDTSDIEKFAHDQLVNCEEKMINYLINYCSITCMLHMFTLRHPVQSENELCEIGQGSIRLLMI